MEDLVFHVEHVEKFLKQHRGLVKEPDDVLRRVKEGADQDGLVMSGWFENLVGPANAKMLGDLVARDPEYMKISGTVTRPA